MRVKMLKNRDVALDGVTIQLLEKGQVVDMRDDLAERNIAAGFAERTGAKLTPAPEPDPSEATPAEPEEEPSEEPSPATAEELAKAYDRNELNALATELGVEDPESLKTKADVADAIVAARA